MGKADLHIHTTYSDDGTATVAAVLAHVAQKTDLDVIAITDHDEVAGALEAMELAPRYGLEVIPGVEVSTAEGHLLALFVHKSIPAQLSLIETVHCVAEMDGLCIAAHPGGRWSWCLSEAAIQRALRDPVVAQTLLGLEAYNASLPDLRLNQKAAAMNRRLALAQVGNSDAHMLWMIGCAATHFPGHKAADLRLALRHRQTTLAVAKRPGYFIASYVKRQLLRQVGLAQCVSPTATSAITLGRFATNQIGQMRQPLEGSVLGLR